MARGLATALEFLLNHRAPYADLGRATMSRAWWPGRCAGPWHRNGRPRGRCPVSTPEGRRTHDGEPAPKGLLPVPPLMSPMRLPVPRAALWSALVCPPARASHLLPALAGRSVASYNEPRNSVPPPVHLGSGGGVLPRAALCSVVVDTSGGLPVHPRSSISVDDTVRSPSGPDRACAPPSPEFYRRVPVRIAYLLRSPITSIG